MDNKTFTKEYIEKNYVPREEYKNLMLSVIRDYKEQNTYRSKVILALVISIIIEIYYITHTQFNLLSHLGG